MDSLIADAVVIEVSTEGDVVETAKVLSDLELVFVGGGIADVICV